MTRERVDTLMAEIGPALDLTEVVRIDDAEATWTVVVDDDVFIVLTYDHDWDRLTLAAEVATPAADERSRVYELVLQYNGQWAATGGVRMALAEPNGALVQLFDLPIASVDVTGFGNVLQRFVEMLRAWRTAISGGLASPAAAPQDQSTIDPAFTGMIRV